MEHYSGLLKVPEIDYGELIRNRVRDHYERKSYAPSYVLVGRDRLKEYAFWLYENLANTEEYRNFQEFYWELRNTMSKIYGLTLIVVDNDKNILEVV